MVSIIIAGREWQPSARPSPTGASDRRSPRWNQALSPDSRPMVCAVRFDGSLPANCARMTLDIAAYRDRSVETAVEVVARCVVNNLFGTAVYTAHQVGQVRIRPTAAAVTFLAQVSRRCSARTDDEATAFERLTVLLLACNDLRLVQPASFIADVKRAGTPFLPGVLGLLDLQLAGANSSVAAVRWVNGAALRLPVRSTEEPSCLSLMELRHLLASPSTRAVTLCKLPLALRSLARLTLWCSRLLVWGSQDSAADRAARSAQPPDGGRRAIRHLSSRSSHRRYGATRTLSAFEQMCLYSTQCESWHCWSLKRSLARAPPPALDQGCVDFRTMQCNLVGAKLSSGALGCFRDKPLPGVLAVVPKRARVARAIVEAPSVAAAGSSALS
jgi:hypothetical protein